MTRPAGGDDREPVVHWVKIGEFSARLGVSPDLLRVWERRYGIPRPRRSPGGSRLYSTLDEHRVRRMLRHIADGVPAGRAAELASASAVSVRSGSALRIAPDEAQEAVREMRNVLERFDEMGAEHVLQRLLAGHSTLAVIRDVMLPYMSDLGQRWAEGEATVAQEHFASKFVLSRLFSLSRGWDRGFGPRVLLACAPGDVHCVGLLAFGVAMHRLGWRVTYLGATTPVDTLAEAAGIVAPDLIVVSCEVEGGLDAHRSELAELGRHYRVMIAGRATTPEFAEACGAGHLAPDPVTAAYLVSDVADVADAAAAAT